MSPTPNPDEPLLARQAKEGSSAAFGVLVHHYHARVFGFLLTLTRHRQDAEDLTQETFVRAWKKFSKYDPTLPLLPWLLTLARRLSIAALRRSKPLPEEARTVHAFAPEAADPALWLWELAKRELPPDAYSALWLHYREELPLKDVAGILGKREGAVKVILHRARKSLSSIVRPKQELHSVPVIP